MNDWLRRPLARSLGDIGRQQAVQQIAQEGKSLPCSIAKVISSGIVQVKWEVDTSPFTIPQVQVPVVMSSYIRFPLKAGDKGACIAADVRLGGVTGLGKGGVPDLTPVGNLTALMFVPLGNTAWSSVDLTATVLFDQTLAHSLSVTGSGVKIDGNMTVTSNQVGFFGGSTSSKQSVTGALSSITDANAKAVLTSLINALAAYSFVTKATT